MQPVGPVDTLTRTAPSAEPTSTTTFIAVVTQPPTNPAEAPVVVTQTITTGLANDAAATADVGGQATSAAGNPAVASSTPAPLSNNELVGSGGAAGGGGLSAGGKTAIAVVIPVFLVALLFIAGLLLWRRRKNKQHDEELRRKEVEDYSFNPNNDPTLPIVGAAMASGSQQSPEMQEDSSGYRGWGNSTSARKASTTISGAMIGAAFSDRTSNPDYFGNHSPGSPGNNSNGNSSDGRSSDPLVPVGAAAAAAGGHTRHASEHSTLGAMAGPIAGANRAEVHRGPSNASSSYSNANRSEHSVENIGIASSTGAQDYSYDATNGYVQPGPYEPASPTYGAMWGAQSSSSQQPTAHELSARRSTRVELPAYVPGQGSAGGISQNF